MSSFQMIKFEVESQADMMERMNSQCFRKCIPNFKQAELTPGEESCLDRCVYKYVEMFTKIITKMQENKQQ